MYIPPEYENHHCSVLQTIEHSLVQAGIRPGKIYHTDRPIGRYTSIRHPGKSLYVHGTEAMNYNPDGIEDPFYSLTHFDTSYCHPLYSKLQTEMAQQLHKFKNLSHSNLKTKVSFYNFLQAKQKEFFKLNLSEQIKNFKIFEGEIREECQKIDKFIPEDKEWQDYSRQLVKFFNDFYKPRLENEELIKLAMQKAIKSLSNYGYLPKESKKHKQQDLQNILNEFINSPLYSQKILLTKQFILRASEPRKSNPEFFTSKFGETASIKAFFKTLTPPAVSTILKIMEISPQKQSSKSFGQELRAIFEPKLPDQPDELKYGPN